ncbi:MAG: hypothetical protein WBA67_04665 [Jannaschia sp.]
MIRLFDIAIAGTCLILTAVGARAQDAVIVRSGEHETFSRLVFPAAKDMTWSEETDARGARTVTFADPDLRLDLAGVFDRIPKDRLADVSSNGPTLTLSLGCPCGFSVIQIGTGHIVIDILDPPPSEAASPDTAQADSLGLPLVLPPSPALAIGFARLLREPAPLPVAGPLKAAALEFEAALPDRPQILIRDHARTGFLPGRPEDEGSTARREPSCSLERVASDILQRDPLAALEDIARLRSSILDDADSLLPTAIKDLAEAYLVLGWGAEAQQILGRGDFERVPEWDQIATALDSDPAFSGRGVEGDSACGPATTTLLMLSGKIEDGWGSVDKEAFVRFIDRLPSERRADFDMRLREGLAQLGQQEILLRLAPVPVALVPYTPPTTEITAAGTDIEAIRATIQILGRTVEEDLPTQEIHLQNALALRPAIPDGPLRREFDEVLARNLLLAGFLRESSEVVHDRPDLASRLLSMALSELPKEEMIEAAIRLRPHLRSDDPGIVPAANIMRDFGLLSAAREFEAIRAGEGIPARPTLRRQPVENGGVIEASQLTAQNQAWLDRDFTAVGLEGDPAAGDGRRQLAAVVLKRTSSIEIADDFDRAQMALEDSRVLSSALETLLDGSD